MTQFLDTAVVNGTTVRTVDASLPITDDGLLRGDGAFEVIRVHRGHALECDAHLQRLSRSASVLRVGLNQSQISADIELLLYSLGEVDCLLHIGITRGGNRFVLARVRPPRRTHVSLAVIPHCSTPILSGVKSLSYAANMLATRFAQERGFDEALLVSLDGHVLDCARSAIFWVDGDIVYTPQLGDGALDSITRRQVMALVEVVEIRCQLANLEPASELFLADTPNGLTAVSRIENVREFNAPGPVARKLGSALTAKIQREVRAEKPGPSG